MKFLKSLLILLFFSVFSIGLVSATPGLNVILSSQTPDPVPAGNFVYVNLKISNTGSDDINDVRVRFEENKNFKLASGEDNIRNIGVLPAYSNENGSNSFVIERFKILVSETAPQGLNTIKFELTSQYSRTFEYDFNVLVEDKSSNLVINNLSVNPMEAGSKTELSFNVKNINSVNLRNVVISLNLDSVSNKALSILNGTNQKVLLNLKNNESKNVKFLISSVPEAESRNYLLPIEIKYEDSLGNFYSQNLISSVEVYSKPIIALKLDSQSIYSSGNAVINFAIANPGISTLKGVQFEILPDKNYEVLSGDYQYVGDLNPDDFQTLQSNIYLKSNKEETIKVKLTYLDAYNNKVEKIVSIPLKIFNESTLIKYGLKGSSESSSSWVTYIVVLLLLGICFLIVKKIGYKKSKKHE